MKEIACTKVQIETKHGEPRMSAELNAEQESMTQLNIERKTNYRKKQKQKKNKNKKEKEVKKPTSYAICQT